MSVTWTEYLRVPDAHTATATCRQRCRVAFQHQRANLLRILDALAPARVACLGAGALNDIPYDHLIQSGTTVDLIDWIPGAIEAGIDQSIITRDESGVPRCVYCHPAVESPGRFCENYVQPPSPGEGVCEHFAARLDEPDRCAAFARGDRPNIVYADITAGFATAFGRDILDALHDCRSWKQAFARAVSLVDHADRERTPLPLPDQCADLVTSSMVVSQFEHEPYDYFSRCALERLGSPSPAEQERLQPTMDALRSTLLRRQLARHCDEIARILAPDGRAYLSFELFHLSPFPDRWFVVEGMPSLLDIFGQRFLFDFDIIPQSETVTRFQVADEPSLVLSLVLAPKPD